MHRSYATGGLVFHKASGGFVIGGPPFRPARLESKPNDPFQMFFSDRKLAIDPQPAGGFGVSPRQPFNANATEHAGVSISLGAGAHIMSLSLFGSRSLITLNPMGDLLVGLGPSLGHSAQSVFVVAFVGITRPPH